MRVAKPTRYGLSRSVGQSAALKSFFVSMLMGDGSGRQPASLFLVMLRRLTASESEPRKSEAVDLDRTGAALRSCPMRPHRPLIAAMGSPRKLPPIAGPVAQLAR